jgi:hypothetical protein
MLGSSKAASAAKSAANTASNAELSMYNQTREDYAPYRDVGYGALSALADVYGIARPAIPGSTSQVTSQQQPSFGYLNSFGTHQLPPRPGTATTTAPAAASSAGPADRYAGFYESPGYQFRLDQGQQAIERGAAARGRLFSGGTLKRTTDYAQGVASQEWNNWLNGLRSLAGVGQSATGSTSAAGANAASGIASSAMNAGAQRASSYLAGAEGVNNAVQGGLGNWVTYKYGY